MEEQKKRNPLETEKEGKLIAKFAIPAIISMLVSSLYNIVDQIFIGQGVGLLGNAATNIAFPVSIICTATALLLGIGSVPFGWQLFLAGAFFNAIPGIILQLVMIPALMIALNKAKIVPFHKMDVHHTAGSEN